MNFGVFDKKLVCDTWSAVKRKLNNRIADPAIQLSEAKPTEAAKPIGSGTFNWKAAQELHDSYADAEEIEEVDGTRYKDRVPTRSPSPTRPNQSSSLGIPAPAATKIIRVQPGSNLVRGSSIQSEVQVEQIEPKMARLIGRSTPSMSLHLSSETTETHPKTNDSTVRIDKISCCRATESSIYTPNSVRVIHVRSISDLAIDAQPDAACLEQNESLNSHPGTLDESPSDNISTAKPNYVPPSPFPTGVNPSKPAVKSSTRHISCCEKITNILGFRFRQRVLDSYNREHNVNNN